MRTIRTHHLHLRSKAPRAGLAVAVVAIACVFGFAVVSAKGAQQLTLRLLGSDFSLWQDISHFIPSEHDPNPRVLVLNTPPYCPTTYDGPVNPTEWWAGPPWIVGTSYPFDSMSHNQWPELTNGFSTNGVCQGGGTDYASSYTSVSMDELFWPMSPESSATDALQIAVDWWKASNPGLNQSFAIMDFDMSMTIQGGSYDGHNVTLPAAVASDVVSDAASDQYNQVGHGDLFFAVDWGVDLLTNREFLIFHISMYCQAGGGYCLFFLPALCQQWLGATDPVSYEQNVLNNICTQLLDGDAHLEGAVPECVFFYDFSGKHTVPPFSTVAAVAGQPPVIDFSMVNQYDAGVEFHLPTASSDIRRGGNACGPTSLTMAVNAAGVQEGSVDTVYANTMQFPPADGINNAFLWPRAEQWLQGKGSYEGTPFPSPRAGALPAHYISDTFLINVGWAQVDGLLARKQPVLIRTDLGTGTSAGGGHVVLLVGKGHYPKLTELTGLSGDCYIVADPAGHYSANPFGRHYDTVESLQDLWQGINYGGWFALYPVELVRSRVTSGGEPTVRALTIGAPFSSSLQFRAECPVTVMVTDPLGNQTGLGTNGAATESIPLSFYQDAFADSEDGTAVDPNGPKTVRVESPLAGTYRLDLVGTNSGPYTLICEQGDTNGIIVASNTVSGTISPNQQATYFFTAAPVDPPLLLSSRQANLLRLFWPTNYVGFTLEATTTPSDSNSWTSAGAVFLEGGFNAFTNPFSASRRYFRLKK